MSGIDWLIFLPLMGIDSTRFGIPESSRFMPLPHGTENPTSITYISLYVSKKLGKNHLGMSLRDKNLYCSGAV